ncbi:MAG: CS1-pili formation C-terminal domain-containing protein, partial [Pseudomonadales bacterium]
LETGLFHLGRRHEFRLNTAVGDNDEYGVNINSRLHLGRARLQANVRRTWTDANTSLIGNELTQASLNLSVPIKGATLNMTGRYNERESGTDRNLGLRLDLQPYRFGRSTLNSSFRITRDNGSTRILLGVRLRLDSEHWSNEFSPSLYYDRPENRSNDKGIISNVTSTWQDRDVFLGDVRLTNRITDERDDETFETELDIASNYGNTNIEAVYSREQDRLSYGANYTGSFLANADTVSFGGKHLARSALVLDIAGNADEESYFDVRINQSLQGSAAIGEKTIFSLRPFETYRIELIPRGSSLINFNNQVKTTTLYPGNVVTMDWQTDRIVVAFGQILDTKNKPVSNAVLDGVQGLATTDQFGLFQAELASSVTELGVRTRESQCRIELPDYDASKTVVQLGKLVCQ